MKIGTLAWKEAGDILQNKIYLLVVFAQVLIVLGAFGLAMASAFLTDPDLLDKTGVSNSLKIGISPDLQGSSLESKLINENIQIVYLNSTQNREEVGKTLIAKIESQGSDNFTVNLDQSSVFYPLVSSKLDRVLFDYRIERRMESVGLTQIQIQNIRHPLNIEEKNITTINRKIALESSNFVQIIYGLIIPFILLLPFFLASNITTDSIVGEKERKTFEVLLMTPLTSTEVVMGKTVPILAFSLIQSIAWMIILELLKVPIFNFFSILLLLFFLGLGFIGVGIFISMQVDSTKEANSAITLVLVLATFLLFFPLFIKISFLENFLNYVPTVLMVKLASTPSLPLESIFYALPTMIISIFIFFLTVKLFKHERAIRL